MASAANAPSSPPLHHAVPVLCHAFAFLRAAELARVSATCTAWRDGAGHDALWAARCVDELGLEGGHGEALTKAAFVEACRYVKRCCQRAGEGACVACKLCRRMACEECHFVCSEGVGVGYTCLYSPTCTVCTPPTAPHVKPAPLAEEEDEGRCVECGSVCCDRPGCANALTACACGQRVCQWCQAQGEVHSAPSHLPWYMRF